MQLNIPRGIIYQTLAQNAEALFSSLFAKLNHTKTINNFEKEFGAYVGSKYCVAFPFARVAIYYSLKLQQFPAGSEIIMPPITIKAILDVVLDLGLKPVFVDIDPDTLCFDSNKLSESITVKTKAILITYLYGMVPDVDAMLNICHKNNIFVLEDFSQCLNGEYKGKKLGSFGDVGVYSSSSIKPLDTYGGGLLVTDNSELYHQLLKCQSELAPPSRKALIKKIYTNILRNVATTRIVFHVLVFPLLKCISYFQPQAMVKNLGERDHNPIKKLPTEWFARYTSVQAAVGLKLLSKVKRQDEIRINNSITIRANSAVKFPLGVSDTKNVFWQTIVYFSDPLKALKLLRDNQIDSATTSLVKISTLSNYNFKGHTPVADMIYSNALFIPAYPRLKEPDITHIVATLNKISHQLDASVPAT
jgi:perosamine synthetase